MTHAHQQPPARKSRAVPRPSSVRAWRRTLELGSDRRAGINSRQLILQRHRDLLRRRWQVFGGVVLLGAAQCIAAKTLLWDNVADYAVGALAVATLWTWHALLTTVDGLAHKRLGIMGEQWTAAELRKLRRQGWRFANHIMLERSDIDHVLLGANGFFAIDSKYRSDWTEQTDWLDGHAHAARRQAKKLQPRIGMNGPSVRPIVVMWGHNLDGRYSTAFEHAGVLFCPGNQLVDHLVGLSPVADQRTIEDAFSRLGQYVAKRDVGEARDFGPVVRSAGDHFNDVLIAILAASTTFVVMVIPIKLPPTTVWSVAIGLGLIAGAVATRRRHSSNTRVQRVTAAIISTAGGWCAVVAIVLVIALLT